MAALTPGLRSRSVQRLWSSLIYILILSGGVASAVIIHRCCPEGLAYSPDAPFDQCKTNLETPRTPAVYSPEKQSFLDPGSVPDDWEYDVGRPLCSQPEFFSLKPNELPPFVLFPNGSLLFTSRSRPELLDQTRFCIDPLGAFVCLDDLEIPSDEARTTVLKCCGLGGQYSDGNASCTTATTDHPEFTRLNAVHGFPECLEVGSFVMAGRLNDTYWLLEDGNLKDEKGSVLGQSQFCLESLAEQHEGPLHVFTCPPRVKLPKHDDIRFTLYPVGLFLSVFFLAVTLIASCLLPSTYHVLHWRCQTNYVACLLIGDLLLAITQLSGEELRGPACGGIAIAMHFIFLAAFFWLNTMCFNIWWTFRDLRPASLDKGQEACRLRVYELYAWGGPMLIAGVGAVLDNIPTEGMADLIRPQFGVHRCWFYGDNEMLYYFFGPIGFLLLLNLTLFGATARELTCGLWKTEVVKSNTERATLGRVCLKLVVVMGVTWVADIVSWVIGGPNYLWYLTDFINTVQGVLIFAVVGCQPQVCAAIKRLWCLSNSPNDNHNVRSSSSHALPSLNDQNTSITNTSKNVETLC